MTPRDKKQVEKRHGFFISAIPKIKWGSGEGRPTDLNY